MGNLKTLEALYNTARWDEIQAQARQAAYRADREEPFSVNQADYALELLGISFCKVETVLDDQGDWYVVWE